MGIISVVRLICIIRVSVIRICRVSRVISTRRLLVLGIPRRGHSRRDWRCLLRPISHATPLLSPLITFSEWKIFSLIGKRLGGCSRTRILCKVSCNPGPSD